VINLPLDLNTFFVNSPNISFGFTAEKYVQMSLISGGVIVGKITALDIGISKVYIILTHGHWDHVSRTAELKEITGAPVLCHKEAVNNLRYGDDPPDTFIPVEPDITIDSDFDLKPYGVNGKVICTPGHSDCSISVVLDSGEAFIGDMVLNSPFTGSPCLALLAADESKLINSMKELVRIAQVFYGGHGGLYSKEEILKLI